MDKVKICAKIGCVILLNLRILRVMKKTKLLFTWGGVSLLIVILVASISLAVWPQKLTNEYGDNAGVVRADTKIIDGVEYEVIYLDGDNEANLTKVYDCNQNTDGNYCYVMTADWDIPAASSSISIRGHSIILDLNGYTFSVSGYIANQVHSYLSLHCNKFTVTDSSMAQSGTVISGNHVFVLWGDNIKEIVVSGGTIKGAIALKRPYQTVIFNGGIFPAGQQEVINYGDGSVFKPTAIVLVAPWMNATYNASGEVTSVKPRYDYFAVSPSDLFSGAYNDVYGYAWELNATQLSNLTISTDRTYYLWGRNKDGWYQYLNLRYVDGAWI